MTPEPSDRCTRVLGAPPPRLPKNCRKNGSAKNGDCCCTTVLDAYTLTTAGATRLTTGANDSCIWPTLAGTWVSAAEALAAPNASAAANTATPFTIPVRPTIILTLAAPFDPAEAVPHMPMLLVAGDKDERATTTVQLAELGLRAGSMAELLVLPGRNHTNAITSRAFKQGAISFLSV